MLEYESDSGQGKHPVRMRDCYVIIMVDNLVRLKHKEDPNRGENRSKQLCLLPITIQGIPADSSVVKSWHEPAICNDTENCPCKQPVIPVKNDIQSALLQLSAKESSQKMKYEKLCTFWNMKIFNLLVNNGKIDSLFHACELSRPKAVSTF